MCPSSISSVRRVVLLMNARSWETSTTTLDDVAIKCSNHWMDSMSRWFVGSSSSKTSGRRSSSLASSIRMRHPPLNSAVGRSKSSRANPRPSSVRSNSA